MTDIATLGLEVKSDSAVTAVNRLSALAEASGKAEKATDDLGAASQRSEGYLKRIASATEATAKADLQIIDILKQMTAAQVDAKVSAEAMGAAQAAASAKATAAAKADVAAMNEVKRAAEEVRLSLTPIGSLIQMVVKEEQALEREAAGLRTAFNPAASALERMNKELEMADKLLQRGKIDADLHGKAVSGARAEYNHATGAAHGLGAEFELLGQKVTLNRTQMMESVHVARALFDTIVAGGSPVRALALESGRVAQIMGAGEGGMAGSMAALSGLMPIVIGAAGFLGLAAALGVAAKAAYDYTAAQDALSLSLMGVGRATGATAKMLEEMAETHSRTANISVGAAREQEAAFIRAGISNTQVIGKMIDISREYALVTGQDQVKANDELAKSFANPIRGVETMIDRIGGIDGATKRYIIELAEHNRLAEAQDTLLRKVSESLQGAEDHVTGLSELLHKGANAWKEYWNEVGKGISVGLAKPGSEEKDSYVLDNWEKYRGKNFVKTEFGTTNTAVSHDDYVAAFQRQQQRDAKAKADAAKAGQDKVSLDAFSAYDTLKPTDAQRSQINGQVQSLKAYRDEMQRLYDTTDHTASGLARLNKARQMFSDGSTAAQHRLEGLDRKDSGPRGPAFANDNQIVANAQRALDRAKASIDNDILSNAKLQKQAVDDQLASELADLDQKRFRNAADKATAEALYREAATVQKQAIDRKSEQEIIAQRAANARILAQYGDEELQIVASMATTLKQRRSIELQLLANRQAEARADLERQIADPKWKTSGRNADAERAGQDALFSAQTRAVKKANQGPLADYVDSIKDVDTAMQNAAVNGIQSLNNGLIQLMVQGGKAKDVLGNVMKQFLMDLAMAELQQAEKGLLTMLGFGVPSADGGGYTGSGSRSGGLDGKGGFVAILHPQETVTDHTKGQTLGGGQMHVTVSVDNNGNLQAYVERVASAKAADAALIGAQGGTYQTTKQMAKRSRNNLSAA